MNPPDAVALRWMSVNVSSMGFGAPANSATRQFSNKYQESQLALLLLSSETMAPMREQAVPVEAGQPEHEAPEPGHEYRTNFCREALQCESRE